MIKDFDYFMDRRSFDVHDGTKANKVFNRMLTVIKGEKVLGIKLLTKTALF